MKESKLNPLCADCGYPLGWIVDSPGSYCCSNCHRYYYSGTEVCPFCFSPLYLGEADDHYPITSCSNKKCPGFSFIEIGGIVPAYWNGYRLGLFNGSDLIMSAISSNCSCIRRLIRNMLKDNLINIESVPIQEDAYDQYKLS